MNDGMKLPSKENEVSGQPSDTWRRNFLTDTKELENAQTFLTEGIHQVETQGNSSKGLGTTLQ